MPGSRDPGGPVDLQPAVVVASAVRRTSVQANADAQPDAGRPRVHRDRLLDRHRSAHGVVRIGKDHEEGVALGADLVTSVLGAGGTNQCLMLGVDLVEAGSELLDEAHGALDVRPEERDRSGG